VTDSNASDDANYSEFLDDDKLPPAYPPDEPLGVDENAVTVAGQETDEPLAERVQREEPDRAPVVAGDDEGQPGRLVEPEAGQPPDLTKDAVASAVDPGLDERHLDAGDIASGDSTTRDVATERVEDQPAEEAAVHHTDDPPMGDGDGYLES
jgi:hypothetical protein